jgi:hypothetical protein
VEGGGVGHKRGSSQDLAISMLKLGMIASGSSLSLSSQHGKAEKQVVQVMVFPRRSKVDREVGE